MNRYPVVRERKAPLTPPISELGSEDKTDRVSSHPLSDVRAAPILGFR